MAIHEEDVAAAGHVIEKGDTAHVAEQVAHGKYGALRHGGGLGIVHVCDHEPFIAFLQTIDGIATAVPDSGRYFQILVNNSAQRDTRRVATVGTASRGVLHHSP